MPAQKGVGLNLEAGVVVVLKLRSEVKYSCSGIEFNLILRKRAEKAVAPTGWIQRNHGSVADIVTGQPVASSPDEVVPSSRARLGAGNQSQPCHAVL